VTNSEKSPQMRILPMLRILCFCLGILLLTSADLWSKEKEIVLENHVYYVIHPNGKKVNIVSSRAPGGPWIEVVFSPDSTYVTYTADNGTGFEGQGRDLYYCRTDGSERTVVLCTSAGIHDLNWLRTGEKQYIVFVEWESGGKDVGLVKAYDFDEARTVFDTAALNLIRIGDTPKLLVNAFLFRDQMAYVLDLSKIPFATFNLDSLGKIESDTIRIRCTHAVLQHRAPELTGRWVGFIPTYWPHEPYNVSKYIDLVPNSVEFTRLSCLVPSPNDRFVGFSATGRRFTCNGILDTKTHKTHALRFFLGSFDGQPCWSPNSEYVAFINLVGGRGKYINVFSIDSVLSSKNPMIIKKNFERPTDKSFEICFSPDSDTLYYEASGWGKPDSGKLTIRR